MNKLNKKVFLTISIILTIFLLTLLIIYNGSSYIRNKRNIEQNLNTMHMDRRPDNKNDLEPREDIKSDRFENKIFMDITLYTIELDENNNISNINSHSENSDETSIKKYVSKLLKSNNLKEVSIGNLYIDRYSYKYNENSTLTIIDNKTINEELQNNLKLSILLFIILEIIIVVISKIITNWIIKPVEESFNKQKQFIADASHELKTPLAVIISNLEIYETDKQKKWLDNISNETERMNYLIKNLLDLAKLENSTRDNYTNNNLSKTVEKQTLTFESTCFEKNIDLDSTIEENIYIDSNAEELKQLTSIILDNAIKHSPKENGKVTVNLYTKGNKIYLEISNRGDPIPKGQEEKIFERFYRVDESRNRGENRYGLGLSIAKNIVTNHKGTIKASSNNGTTTFQIVLKK